MDASSIFLVVGLAVASLAVFGLFHSQRTGTRSSIIGLAMALFCWILTMHIWGDHAHYGPFFSYPLWLVLVAGGVALLVILLAFALPGSPRNRRNWAVTADGAVALALILVASLMWVQPAGATAKATHKSKPHKQVHVQAAKKGQVCTNGYPVVLDPNFNHRILSKGLHGLPPQMVKQYVAAARHDPRALVNVYNVGFKGQYPPINIVKMTKDGCYTLAGIEADNKLAGAFSSPRTKVVASTAPSSGVNTGAIPGGANYTATQAGVSGNRTGIMVSFPNGNTFWIMKRCGNVVTAAPPSTSTTSSPPSHTSSPPSVTTTTVSQHKPPKHHHHKPPTTTTTRPKPQNCAVTGKPPVQGVCGKHASQSSLNNPKVPAVAKGCDDGGGASGTCSGLGPTPSSPISIFTNVGTDGFPTAGSDPNPPTTVPTTTLPACEYRSPDGTCSNRPVTTDTTGNADTGSTNTVTPTAPSSS